MVKHQLADKTMYELYVRVPDGQNLSSKEVQAFVQDMANHLTNKEHAIQVETYEDYSAESDELPAGGPANPLIPLYVCHNKAL
jgi:hypothetical protein